MITDIEKIDVKRISRRKGNLTKKVNIKDVSNGITTENIMKLQEYQSYWDSLYTMRRDYMRTFRYVIESKQWEDVIQDENGDWITERQNIINQGRIPLVQNVMRPLMKSLDGIFRAERGKPIVISRKPDSAELEEVISNAVQEALDVNDAKEIDTQMFKIYQMSGLPLQRLGYDFNKVTGNYQILIENLNPMLVFFNTDIADTRGSDLRVFGIIHDVTFDNLKSQFAKTEADVAILKKIYSGIDRETIMSMYGLDSRRIESIDFYIPSEQGKCRVIEAWEEKPVLSIEYWDQAAGEEGTWEGTTQEIDQINNQRIAKYTAAGLPEEEWALIVYESAYTPKWFFKYLSPDGHILREGQSPYHHNRPPIVMNPYPLINGVIRGPLQDNIDQQRSVNRLYTMADYILNTTTKNTLVIDENSLNGQSVEQISNSYTRIGGVISLDLKGAQKPFELQGTNAMSLGINEMIAMNLKWIQDISGVQPAQQGQSPSSGTSASRYAQESANATNNNLDTMETFNAFRKRRDYMVLELILQFYKNERYMAISGNDNKNNIYDPKKFEGMSGQFNLVIGQSTDSPVYKTWRDEQLLTLVDKGLINIEMALPHIDAPWAAQLLDDIKNTREQIQNGTINGQDAQAAVGNMAQQFNQNVNVDQNKINALNSAIARN